MSPQLAYVALVVSDVDQAAAAFERAFGFSRADRAGAGGGPAALFPVGASAIALLAPGDPRVDGASRPGVHHIGLEAPDLAAATRAAEADGLRPGASKRPASRARACRWRRARRPESGPAS